MRYSENLHLNLPEDSDPLEIDKISENFEVLDGAIKEQSKASGYQVFHLKVNETAHGGRRHPRSASPRFLYYPGLMLRYSVISRG